MKLFLDRQTKAVQVQRWQNHDFILWSYCHWLPTIFVRMVNFKRQIGGKDSKQAQQFKVLFDTGSTDTFIPSVNCTSRTCKIHNKYKLSDTYEFVKNAGEISYVSGSHLIKIQPISFI